MKTSTVVPFSASALVSDAWEASQPQESRTSRRQSGTERELEAGTAGARVGSSGGKVRNRTRADSGTDKVKCNT